MKGQSLLLLLCLLFSFLLLNDRSLVVAKSKKKESSKNNKKSSINNKHKVKKSIQKANRSSDDDILPPVVLIKNYNAELTNSSNTKNNSELLNLLYSTDKFKDLDLSKQLKDYSIFSVNNFPLPYVGNCLTTVPDETPKEAYLFTDIFISGSNIKFVSIIYPDVPIDYYSINFRVVEKEKINKNKIRRVGKNLRIVELTINSLEKDKIVLGVISSPKLESYLELTDSLVMEVTYGSYNLTYHLFRDSRKLNSLLPQNLISAFSLLNREAEATIISWMDYHIKYVGISHFIFYYNGILSKSKNIASLIKRVKKEKRMVVFVEWNQPYRRLMNSSENEKENENAYQSVSLPTAIHSAYYRFRESLNWIYFSEIGTYIIKNTSNQNILKYFEECKKKSGVIIEFDKTQLGYMFEHRHRNNIDDTNIDIFSKEVMIKGNIYAPPGIYRLKFVAYKEGVKLLPSKYNFVFSLPKYHKVSADYDTIRIVTKDRFNMVYGNLTDSIKTSFIEIQNDLSNRWSDKFGKNSSIFTKFIGTTVR